MAKPPTQPSTPRLSEVARHVVIPAGIVSTAWPRVVAKCAELGVEFDPWQHGIGAVALGKRADGKYAASVGGIVLSIPRQVGKTFLTGMIVIALCLLFPGMTVLWTAHRGRTTTKTFHTMKGMTDRPKVKPYMLEPRMSNGEQEIRFRNGSVIMFGAREQGFGRGFDEVDIEVFDEAQILTERALEDMVPATNQSRQGSGALLFFMGTPPRPTDPGAEFSNRRARAIAGESDDTVYVEFSADEDCDPEDRAQWAKANPSYPWRTDDVAMRRMRANLTDDASFRREALGIWTLGGGSLFPMHDYEACADLEGAKVELSDIVLAVEMTLDRDRAVIAACGRRPDGIPQGELVDYRDGSGWVVARCQEIAAKRWIREVVIDDKSPAAPLIPEFEAAGFTVTKTGPRDMANACGSLYDAVVARNYRHVPHLKVSQAILDGRRRRLGDAWAIDRRSPDVDVSPLVAASLAHWACARERVTDPGVYVI